MKNTACAIYTMHNNFHTRLSLPVPFCPKLIDTVASTVPYQMDHHSPLVQWLTALGIEVVKTGAEQFYIGPYQSIPIHIDGKTFDHKVKINFQYGGQGSVMKWYKPTKLNIARSEVSGPLGPYTMMSKNQVTAVWSAEIGTPSLINAGILHNVENQSAPRWVVSVPLWDTDRAQNLQWDQAVEKFAQWIE